MKTISVHMYQFKELDDKAKEAARKWFRKDYPDHGWWDCIYNDAKEIAKYFGVEIDKIGFSGFWSQGDGAYFTGQFRGIDLNTLDALKESYPTEEHLHSLLRRLLRMHHPDESWISIDASGRYSHSATMTFDDYDDSYTRETLEEIMKCLRSFADWIYARLEKEHKYLTSDECVDESIIANEYWFLVDGTRFSHGDD